MASLILVKIMDNVMFIKESENLKGHPTEALAILSHARVNHMDQKGWYYILSFSWLQTTKKSSPKKFAVPIENDLNQGIQAITKTFKTIKTNLSSSSKH